MNKRSVESFKARDSNIEDRSTRRQAGSIISVDYDEARHREIAKAEHKPRASSAGHIFKGLFAYRPYSHFPCCLIFFVCPYVWILYDILFILMYIKLKWKIKVQ